MSHLNEDIAAAVMQRRNQAGLTRPQLAEASGIAERTLARRESGHSSWNSDELDAIATVLECRASDLLQPDAEAGAA